MVFFFFSFADYYFGSCCFIYRNKTKTWWKEEQMFRCPPFEGTISHQCCVQLQPTHLKHLIFINARVLSPACATIQCPPLSTCVDAVCKCNADTLEENGVCVKGEKLLRRSERCCYKPRFFIFYSVLIFSQLKRFRVNLSFKRLLLKTWVTQTHWYSMKRPKTSETQ